MVNVAAFYDGPADRAVRQDWVDRFAAALQQDDHGPTSTSSATKGPTGSARPTRGRPGSG